MKWGSSGRAKKVLSNGPTLRSKSFFCVELEVILCCSNPVFGSEQQLSIGRLHENPYFGHRVATDPEFFCDVSTRLEPTP